ncbi:asparaginase [Candidatus Micrarchaeota archaeon]|nr:asparaginase [Candidatus Micrarchaeota archaeon]
MAIRLFITGGTIEKSTKGPPHVGYDVQKTVVHDVLKEARCSVPVAVEQLMNKSSRNLTDEDRALIAQKCNAATEDQIVITHGTITMSQTAEYLAQHVQHKTVVLTGSMVPFAVGQSDAGFNLGAALVAVQTQPLGVYVVMEGRVFNYSTEKYAHDPAKE